MRYYISTLLFLFSLSSYSQDSSLVSKVMGQLSIDKSRVKSDLVVSKVRPDNIKETIMVIPEIVEEDDYYFELNSYILIVDNRTERIKHKYFESSKTNGWSSDAVILTEITIDTAPYKITEKSRAFGVRVHYYGMSKANPYSNTTISLFVKSDNTLKKVLDNYDIMDYGGEWDTNCAGEFTEHKKILIMMNSKTKGYSDILVRDKITTTKNYEDGDGVCDYKEHISLEKTLLKFNGEEYIEKVL